MNKKISVLVAISILVTIFASIPTFAATANPTASTVLVDGKNVAFDAYNIADNNYFKLRDLAFTLSGAPKQFEVGWDGENNAISLTSGQSYTVVGGEMTGKGGGAKEATPTDSRIYLNGREVQFTAYNIDGNNYFKLRDIGEAFDFGVDWDGERNTIAIDTSKGYSLDGGTATTVVPVPMPTVDPLPDATPEPTPEPSGSISPDLVGQWGGALSGYSHYYDFKADGTFLYRMTNSIYVGGNYMRTENDYFRGTWYENGGTVYMTNRYYADFVGGSKPPDDLSWTKMPDQTMRIKFDVNKDEDRLYFGRRCFFNMEIVYVTPDGSLPDAYLELIIDNLPDWVFP